MRAQVMHAGTASPPSSTDRNDCAHESTRASVLIAWADFCLQPGTSYNNQCPCITVCACRGGAGRKARPPSSTVPQSAHLVTAMARHLTSLMLLEEMEPMMMMMMILCARR